MGGIPTNIHGEVVKGPNETVVPGLMAIGEAACVSVHGANRLGTNSLLDLIVFGRAAALRAKEVITPNTPHAPLPKDAGQATLAWFDKLRHANGSIKTGDIRLALQETMQSNCAVFRSDTILKEGINKIENVGQMMHDHQVNDRSLIWNTDLVEAIELVNLYQQSIVTIKSALHRTESRGAHARDDYPDRDDANWMVHTQATLLKNGDVSFETRPVHMYTLTDEVAVVPPKKRTY
jgi:succinate dehydrogenase / fumarate reductase flavoprotein subunit